jgi:two-component sensor histidine kinase
VWRKVLGLLCLFAAYLVVVEVLSDVFNWGSLVSALMQLVPYCIVLGVIGYFARPGRLADNQALLLALCLGCVLLVFTLNVTRNIHAWRAVWILGDDSKVRNNVSSLALMIALASFPAAGYFLMEELFQAKTNLDEQVEKLRRAEKALTFQKMILEAQSEASIDGIMTVDDQRQVILHNRRFAELWDLPPDALELRSEVTLLPLLLEKVVHPEVVLKGVEHLYEGQDEVDLVEIALKDGRTLERFSAPVRSAAGALLGRIWVYRDITGQIQAQLELRRLYEQTRLDAETKTELLQEVNHRVKNNLISIVGLIQTQRRYTPNEKYGPVVKATLGRLEQQIRGLIEVHQILSGTRWRPVLLSELAERVITAVAGMVESGKQVTLKIVPSPVLTSPRQSNSVGLALSELATNTLKHAAPDRASTAISVEIERQDEYIVLKYRDNGPGFPSEVLNGQQRGVGLVLLEQLAFGAFRGSLSLANADGAVVTLRIKNDESDRT